MDSIPDAVLIEQERRHTVIRVDAFKCQVETARIRAQDESVQALR